MTPTFLKDTRIRGSLFVDGMVYGMGMPLLPVMMAQAQNVYFVSENIGSDGYDGLTATTPKATIQAAVTLQGNVGADGDVILVAPGDYSEAVTTPVVDTGSDEVFLIGTGPTRHSTVWASGAAGSNCLVLRARGWLVSGFRWTGPASAYCVQTRWDNSTHNAERSVIKGNFFDGAWAGLGGIDFWGAPSSLQVIDNDFAEFDKGGGLSRAISSTASATANAFEAMIIGNRFYENENHIARTGSIGVMNASYIMYNTFATGALQAPTIYLDMRSGSNGKSVIYGNFFGGTYTTTGGYHPNATGADSWVGNICENVASAYCGDNGLSVAAPGA